MYYVSQVTCCRLAVWVVFGCLSGNASSCCGTPGIGAPFGTHLSKVAYVGTYWTDSTGLLVVETSTLSLLQQYQVAALSM